MHHESDKPLDHLFRESMIALTVIVTITIAAFIFEMIK
jgi:hypothetical protein